MPLPPELTARPQWVMWKKEQRHGKLTKVPYQITGMPASHSKPATWERYDVCYRMWQRGGFSGIGYVFSKDDPFIGIDLDHVVADGCYTDTRYADLVDTCNTYTEYSQSGTGLHLIGYGTMPNGRGRRKHPIEVYDRNRFFAMTGRSFSHTLNDVQSQVDKLLATFTMPSTVEQPQPRVDIPPVDQDVLVRALRARNGVKVGRLYAGDWTGYTSQSEADLALLSALAFWTQDAHQLTALWRDSNLWRKQKCTTYYVAHTVTKALSNLSHTYKG